MLINELKKIHARNYGVYGVRKMWHAARRAGWDSGRLGSSAYEDRRY